jgi:hypothetical protein
MKSLPKYDDLVPNGRATVLPAKTKHSPDVCLVSTLIKSTKCLSKGAHDSWGSCRFWTWMRHWYTALSTTSRMPTYSFRCEDSY